MVPLTSPGGFFRVPGLADDSACTETRDLPRVEAELLEDLFVVFADLGRSLRRHFRDTVNLQWTADCGLQLSTSAFERYDNVIDTELRIADDFAGRAHDPVRDVALLEHLLPVSNRLRVKHFVENGRKRAGIRDQLCRIGETSIREQVRPADSRGETRPFI